MVIDPMMVMFQGVPSVAPGYPAWPRAHQANGPALQVPAELEMRIRADFLQGVASDLIRKLYGYLDQHARKSGQLADLIQVVRQAAEAYGARDYARSVELAFQAYRTIALVRCTVSQELPAL